MEAPVQFAPREIAPDFFILPAAAPLPGAGVLAANAFLIRGREPMLIDTGFPFINSDFVAALGTIVDPADITRVFMTHADVDHLGAYEDIMALAPKARVMIGMLGQAKMALRGLPGLDRMDVVAPGDTFEIGGHRLTALRPPYYDAPETLGLYDATSDVLITTDAFGALLPGPYEDARDIPRETLEEGLNAWSALDAPWLEMTDPARLASVLASFKRLAPKHILSSHLAPARDFDTLSNLVLNAASRMRGNVSRAAA